MCLHLPPNIKILDPCEFERRDRAVAFKLPVDRICEKWMYWLWMTVAQLREHRLATLPRNMLFSSIQKLLTCWRWSTHVSLSVVSYMSIKVLWFVSFPPLKRVVTPLYGLFYCVFFFNPKMLIKLLDQILDNGYQLKNRRKIHETYFLDLMEIQSWFTSTRFVSPNIF